MSTETSTQYDPYANPFGHAWYIEERDQAGGITFTDVIDFFDMTPEGDFLSNFYESEPVTVDVGFGEQTYRTTEHAYAAAKAYTRADHDWIVANPDPGVAKSRGRRVERDGSARPDWDEVKPDIMARVIAVKFPLDASHPLTQRLLATGRKVLIEGTAWDDHVWGVAYDPTTNGMTGRNLLGVILMERRGVLRASLGLA